jgi:hypothetical protein
VGSGLLRRKIMILASAFRVDIEDEVGGEMVSAFDPGDLNRRECRVRFMDLNKEAILNLKFCGTLKEFCFSL